MNSHQKYPIIMGTAGHIDHGKTTLVKALTGQDTDRLPEEKRRGITIDLGFAHMTLPSGQSVAFIDVPGHERFIRNMVAGVHGMDAVLLVVAADEGVMPQTTEHLAILRLLGVQHGMVVITKADLADEETLDLVKSLVADAVSGTFLERAPVAVVDAISGKGLSELKSHLSGLCESRVQVEDGELVRLPIDRVFSVKGFGTVVTGTLVCGRMNVEDVLELVPTDKTVRVRGLEVHNQPVVQASRGQRVAVNVAGVNREEMVRGRVLASPGSLRGIDVAAVEVELLASSPPLGENTRVHVHSGTAETLGRIFYFDRRQLEPGRMTFAELRLETTIPLKRRDRFLIRAYSPVFTIGGGVVLEVGIHHHRKEALLLPRLASLARDDDTEVLRAVLHPLSGPEDIAVIAQRMGTSAEKVLRFCQDDHQVLILDSRYLWDHAAFLDWLDGLRHTLLEYNRAHPFKPGMPLEVLKSQRALHWPPKAFRSALDRGNLVVDREWVRISQAIDPLKQDQEKVVDAIFQAIAEGGLNPPSFDLVRQRLTIPLEQFDDVVERLFLARRLVRLQDGLAISEAAYQSGRKKVAEALKGGAHLTTSELKEVLGISRRLAVLFLELLDREHVTRRIGDNRELVR